jgi:hypothetical protein
MDIAYDDLRVLYKHLYQLQCEVMELTARELRLRAEIEQWRRQTGCPTPEAVAAGRQGEAHGG